MQDERNIGPNIARLCGLYGVSQQEVARCSGMSVNGLNNLVKQRTLRPSFSSLQRVSECFGMSAGHLTLPARDCAWAAIKVWNEGKFRVTSVGDENLEAVSETR